MDGLGSGPHASSTDTQLNGQLDTNGQDPYWTGRLQSGRSSIVKG